MVRRLLKFLWRPAVCLWGTLGALALYFLMAGPLVWLVWNVQLPDWLAVVISVVLRPLEWIYEESDVLHELLDAYVKLWVDFTKGSPATQPMPMPDGPPYFVGISGTLIGAWLVWNIVRWINQRKEAPAH